MSPESFPSVSKDPSRPEPSRFGRALLGAAGAVALALYACALWSAAAHATVALPPCYPEAIPGHLLDLGLLLR